MGQRVPLPIEIFTRFYIGLSFISVQTEVKPDRGVSRHDTKSVWIKLSPKCKSTIFEWTGSPSDYLNQWTWLPPELDWVFTQEPLNLLPMAALCICGDCQFKLYKLIKVALSDDINIFQSQSHYFDLMLHIRNIFEFAFTQLPEENYCPIHQHNKTGYRTFGKLAKSI